MRIPLDQIDPHALIRDRSLIDSAALEELKCSIAASGLRQPVEVFQTETGYGLISGYRRLAAVKGLHELTGAEKYAEIDAVLRTPADRQAAFAAMVEENDMRQDISPWERAAIAHNAVAARVFDTLDAALTAVYPNAARQKRAKLRAIADVVEALDGILTDPELISETRLLRIAAVRNLGWGELIETALLEGSDLPAAQWDRLRPVLEEAEMLVKASRPTTPNRPRRLSRPRGNITVRRERTRSGYLLHVTGAGATGALMDDVLKEIERWLSPG